MMKHYQLIMRKVKIESVEDLEALPEDEWVEAPWE